jgi:hypothetical protein
MSKYLAIVVLVCAIELSQALKTDPKLVVTELNHVKGEDRVTQFDCQFEKADGETINSVTVTKKKGTDNPPVFTRTLTQDPAPGVVADEIATTDITIPDKTKNVFTIKKAAKIEGEFTCAVVSSTVGSKTAVYNVKKDRETIDFKVETEGANDKKQEFGHDAKLDATLDYVMADDKSVLVKAEFRKEDLVFFRYTADGEHLDSVDDAKDKGVKAAQVTDAKHDTANHKLTLVIKDAVKETGGKYNVKFYYKDNTAADTLDFMSKDVTLTYTGGAATTMISFASISTLLVALVAMRSNL